MYSIDNEKDRKCSIKIVGNGVEKKNKKGRCGKKGPDYGPRTPRITEPEDGEEGNDSTPDSGGTGDKDNRIYIFIDGIEVGSTFVGDDETWSFEMPTPLSDGEHIIHAIAEDSDGNRSDSSEPIHIIIDTVIGTPAITYPADGTTINDGTYIEGGNTDPQATVEIFIDGTAQGSVIADASGQFVLVLESPMPDGFHEAYAYAFDIAGNLATSELVSFNVDTVIGTPVLDPIGVISNTNPIISGSGTDAGAEVAIIIDENLVGVTSAMPDGTFSLTAPSKLLDGEHTVYAVAADGTGNTATSDTLVFTIDTVDPEPPVFSIPMPEQVVPVSPIFEGTAEPSTQVDIYIDGVLAGSTTADVAGLFVFTLGTPLPLGRHFVSATAMDPAGNTSEQSLEIPFFVE